MLCPVAKLIFLLFLIVWRSIHALRLLHFRMYMSCMSNVLFLRLTGVLSMPHVLMSVETRGTCVCLETGDSHVV